MVIFRTIMKNGKEQPAEMKSDDPRLGLPSASSFDRRVHCPGSLHAEAAMGDVEQVAQVAVDGSAIAAAIAADDLSELGIKQEDVAAKLADMNKQALEDWKKDFGVTECEVYREQRFWVMDGKNRAASCQVDFAAISKDGRFALLVDDKSGFKEVVRASANWQLKVGIVAMECSLATGFDKARVAIAQHRMGSRFDACDYNDTDIEQAYNEVLFFCHRLKPDAERTAGEWCQYCKARTQCQEHALYAMMPMLRAQMVDVLPKKAEVEARVALLPLEALAFIESRRTVATNLFKAVTDRLKGLPSDALAALGYKLKPSGGTRSIPDLAALWGILSANNLCSAEEFRQFCKISMGDMEEKLVPRIKLMQELESNKAAELVLKGLIDPVVKVEEEAPQLKALK